MAKSADASGSLPLPKGVPVQTRPARTTINPKTEAPPVTVTGYNPHEDNATFLDERHAYVLAYGEGSEPIGLIESHQLADGRWCEGSVMFKGRGGGTPEWTVVLEDPLTLSPSILCRECGSHGYIEGGRWRSA